MDIEHVLKNGNCHQCGICVGVCPVNAIEIYQDESKGQFPKFIREKCTDCGLCYETCPGENLDWHSLKKYVIDSNQRYFPEIGTYRKIYSGFATDEFVRKRGASGGIASNILIYMLQKGEIDGAIVVRMSRESPLEPEIYIAKTKSEIIESQQSKYLPVPLGIILKKIMKTKGKFAIVGLPCHIQGIRQAQQRMPKLRKRIVLLIGLFCGFHPNFTSTKFLVRRAGVNKIDEIKEIRYRDHTWPGGFNVITKDGHDHLIHPVDEFFWAHKVFERARCMTCIDGYAEFADLSLGDEWRSDNFIRSDYKKGWSYIITHTKKGDDIVKYMERENVIYIEEVEPEIVAPANMPKKELAWASMKIRKFFGLAIPNYHYVDNKQNIRLKIYVAALMIMIVSRIMEVELIYKIAVIIPTNIFKKYQNLIYKFLGGNSYKWKFTKFLLQYKQGS